MEFKLFEDVIDHIRPIFTVVDSVEGVKRSVHRKCRHAQTFEIWRDGGDTRCDTDTEILELAQLLHRKSSTRLPRGSDGTGKRGLRNLGDTKKMVRCLTEIAHLFYVDKKLGAAEGKA